MKANELMIGDWVTSCKWSDNPFKVTRINQQGKYIYGETLQGASVGPFLIDEIESIPLTPEILEKNGFSVGIYNILKIDENRRLEYYHYKNRLTLYYKGVDEWDNHTEQEETIFICQCVYVHKLQNALRLCGIDKKITL